VGIYGLRGVEWAVEQINAEGGVLGRPLEVVVENSDYINSGGDLSKSSTAMIRLLEYHDVDFIIGATGSEVARLCQDLSADHKRIFINTFGISEFLTQRVEENYERYKYFFRYMYNDTVLIHTLCDSIKTLGEYSGLKKIALITDFLPGRQPQMAKIESTITESDNFEVVYNSQYTRGTIDFSSYFAAMEAAGAEIIVPFLALQEGISFVKEWYDRQSPTIMWGVNIAIWGSEAWNITEGKCEYSTQSGNSFNLGYAISSLTLPTRMAYVERFGEDPKTMVGATYDAVRFVLFDALERAGTIDTDKVILALEETSIETSYFPIFRFAENHDYFYTESAQEDESVLIYFQWQNGQLVPVYTKEAMQKTGVTYMFPDWSGPWDDIT
jgi:branched-chain amino acid transport system substrate-binding protein